MEVKFRSDRAFETAEQTATRRAKARRHQLALQLQIEEKRQQKVSTAQSAWHYSCDLCRDSWYYALDNAWGCR